MSTSTPQRHCLAIAGAARAAFIAFAASLLFWLAPEARASEAPGTCRAVVDSIEVQVLFPMGKSDIDLTYKQNGTRLADFVERLHKADADPAICPGRIHIVGYASPDGGYRFNQRMARERAENLAAYLRTQVEMPDSLVVIEVAGIDWQGLDRAVGESSLSDRTKARVQNIIRNEPEFTYDSRGVLTRSRKQQLQNLDGGRTWNWMMDNLYPALRSSASVVGYIERVQPEAPAAETSDAVTEAEAESRTEPGSGSEATSETKPAPVSVTEYPILALRSNLLLPLHNVGIQVPVAEHWTVGADYCYPWIWPAESNKSCFELLFVSAEARYWFKGGDNARNSMLGHSIGAYGAWGYYDIERNWHGYQGRGWSAGVDYMYTIPIARGRLHLAFEIAAGAVWSIGAQPYNVFEHGGNLIKESGHTKNFSYFGPTKAGVSIVLPISRRVKHSAPARP